VGQQSFSGAVWAGCWRRGSWPADCYDDVVVVERDALTTDVAHRRGVPQAHHVHGLLSAGSNALDQLFPGLLAEYAGAGATVLTEDLSRVSLSFNGHLLKISSNLDRPVPMYMGAAHFSKPSYAAGFSGFRM
jgi:hypothetical protein